MKKSHFIIMMALMGCLSALATDIYLPAMPNITVSLATSLDNVQISLAIFFSTFAIGQLIYGPISDKYGRRKILLFGIALFAFSALVCALASTIEMLIFGRFLLGLGACAGVVSSFAICKDKYTKKELLSIIAIISATIGVAPLVAPVLGSALNNLWGWQSIFYFLSAYALILYGWIYSSLEETNKYTGVRKIASKTSSYWAMLRNRNFSLIAIPNACAFMALFAYIASSPVLFMKQWQFTEFQYALLFASNALWMLISNIILSKIAKKFNPEYLLKFGTVACVTAGIVMYLFNYIFINTNAFPDFTSLIASIIGFMIFMGIITSTIAVIISTSMSVLLDSYDKQSGQVIALAGCIRFGCGFLIALIVSQTPQINVETLAVILVTCGIVCTLSVFIFYKGHRYSSSIQNQNDV